MNIKTEFITLNSQGNTDIIDITHQVEGNLRKVGFEEGLLTIFCPGSTGGLTTVEFEPGLKKDLKRFFDKVVPPNIGYAHDDTWHDGNGHAHVRSSLLKTSLTVPFSDKKLILGTWQQIVFIDFDVRPRRRKIVTQFVGK